MKKKLLLAAFMLTAATSFAVRENLGPAITGTTDKGSWVDVRVTANVVDGIAVNEASPIDFGNLVRDTSGNMEIYNNQERINEIKEGIVTYRASTGYNTFKTWIAQSNIDLIAKEDVKDDDPAQGTTPKREIGDVRITGIKYGKLNDGSDGEIINMTNGTARRTLHAWFYAYDTNKANGNANNTYQGSATTGNLGKSQLLGNYEGTVKVYAIAENPIVP